MERIERAAEVRRGAAPRSARHPTRPAQLQRLGQSWLHLVQLDRPAEERLAAYNHALAIDPDSATAWYNLGVARGSLKRQDEALAAYDRALTLDPNDLDIWLNRGTVLWELKRYDVEIAAYDQALAIDPNYAKAWSYKVITLRKLGRDADAEEAERQANTLGE